MSGRKVGKRKFSCAYRKTTENDNQQSYGIAFFDQQLNPNNDLIFLFESLNSLSNLFSQYKFHVAEETQMLVAL